MRNEEVKIECAAGPWHPVSECPKKPWKKYLIFSCESREIEIMVWDPLLEMWGLPDALIWRRAVDDYTYLWAEICPPEEDE